MKRFAINRVSCLKIATIFSLFFCYAAHADTLFVDQLLKVTTTQNYSIKNRDVSGNEIAFNSIQLALNSMNTGDVVVLRKGIYKTRKRIEIPPSKSGTSWNPGEFNTLESYRDEKNNIEEWAILDGENSLERTNFNSVIGYNGKLAYWKFLRLEIRNGMTSNGLGACGFHADGGPFVFQHCKFVSNQCSTPDNNPAGLSGHTWTGCLVEYCYFRDNGAKDSKHENSAHLVIYSDYDYESISKNGFKYLGDGRHVVKNIIRNNFFDRGAAVGIKFKAGQMLSGRVGALDTTFKDYGCQIYNNILVGHLDRGIYLQQDFAQVHNNIVDSCGTGITVGSIRPTYYRQTVYNNTFKNCWGGAIAFYHLDYDVPERFATLNNYEGFGYNNISENCGYSENAIWEREEFSMITSKTFLTATFNGFKFKNNYSYRPAKHSKDSDANYMFFFNPPNVSNTRLTVDQLNSMSFAENNYLNSFVSTDPLFQSNVKNGQFKTRKDHKVTSNRTISTAGIGGMHPFLNKLTMPNYIGATDPNDPLENSWIETVINLKNLGNDIYPLSSESKINKNRNEMISKSIRTTILNQNSMLNKNLSTVYDLQGRVIVTKSRENRTGAIGIANQSIHANGVYLIKNN